MGIIKEKGNWSSGGSTFQSPLNRAVDHLCQHQHQQTDQPITCRLSFLHHFQYPVAHLFHCMSVRLTLWVRRLLLMMIWADDEETSVPRENGVIFLLHLLKARCVWNESHVYLLPALIQRQDHSPSEPSHAGQLGLLLTACWRMRIITPAQPRQSRQQWLQLCRHYTNTNL